MEISHDIYLDVVSVLTKNRTFKSAFSLGNPWTTYQQITFIDSIDQPSNCFDIVFVKREVQIWSRNRRKVNVICMMVYLRIKEKS